MSLYTRTGDDGMTSYADGHRARKDDPLIEAFGALDEANCHIGLARDGIVDSELDAALGFVQHRLFDCSAALSAAVGHGTPHALPDADDITALERVIDRYEERSGAFAGFVIPGGDTSASRLQVARAVLRRAERRLVTALDGATGAATALAFVNRAADLLYAAARYTASGSETPWESDAARP
ncbi:MAG: cob(I)yrinic acid a,c-diamide adenosyltransferase [Coriobacteriia bacterium]|nr:cob(I)yrinic acid a,c-diamide adenosyltransferase [Coriobacteriia bacterium]